MKTFGQKPKGLSLQRILQSPHFNNGSFQNIVPTEINPRKTSIVKTSFEFFTGSQKTMPTKPLPHVKTDLRALPDTAPTVVWFGHSSYLLKYQGRTILVDPVFSGYSSPVPLFVKAFPGTDAYRVEDLPEIDLLVITHDHYDHLDYETALALKSKVKQVCTTLGVAAHLEYWGYPSEIITELDWWESHEFAAELKITATPARHFSGRALVRSRTLWASFVVAWGSYKIFLGGDSGYDSQFKKIGEHFGPFDWAFLECGQYNEGWPLIHMFPERTANAAADLQAKVLMPVHWGKFALSLHPWNESVRRLLAAVKDQKMAIPKIGQPVTFGGDLPMTPWWED